MQKLTANHSETTSPDLYADNLAKLRALFPELVTEGSDGIALNLDVLKVLVGDKTVTDAEEKYGLNWHGKRLARQIALTPSTGTLGCGALPAIIQGGSAVEGRRNPGLFGGAALAIARAKAAYRARPRSFCEKLRSRSALNRRSCSCLSLSSSAIGGIFGGESISGGSTCLADVVGVLSAS